MRRLMIFHPPLRLASRSPARRGFQNKAPDSLSGFFEELIELDPREDERPDAFQVIFHNRLADVILVCPVALFRLAEAGDFAALREVDVAVLAGADEVAQDAVVAFA